MGPMERIQVAGFSIQEIIISVIYITATLKMLKGSFDKRVRNTTTFLVLIQAIAILSDILVIGLDYAEYFTLKAVIHSFVYAFKLQLEFVILNEFKAVSQGGLAPRSLQDFTNSSTHASTRNGAERKWWNPNKKSNHSEELSVRRGMGQAKGWQESSDEASSVGVRIAIGGGDLSRISSSKDFDSSAIKPYVPGKTDTVDQYLGAWDRIERSA